MKTAEEWNSQIRQDGSKEAHNYQVIKQIQLDAIKEGMRRAAEIAKEQDKPCYSDEHAQGCYMASKAILTKAEQLTIKDL